MVSHWPLHQPSPADAEPFHWRLWCFPFLHLCIEHKDAHCTSDPYSSAEHIACIDQEAIIGRQRALLSAHERASCAQGS